MREAAPSDFEADARDASPAAATFEADASGGSTAAMGKLNVTDPRGHPSSLDSTLKPYVCRRYSLPYRRATSFEPSRCRNTTLALARLSEAANQAPTSLVSCMIVRSASLPSDLHKYLCVSPRSSSTSALTLSKSNKHRPAWRVATRRHTHGSGSRVTGADCAVRVAPRQIQT